MFGPYIDLPPGCYDAQIFFAPAKPPSGRAVMDIAVNYGNKLLAEKAITLPGEDNRSLRIRFETSAEDRGVEVRLMCEPGFRAVVIGVEIKPDLPAPAAI